MGFWYINWRNVSRFFGRQLNVQWLMIVHYCTITCVFFQNTEMCSVFCWSSLCTEMINQKEMTNGWKNLGQYHKSTGKSQMKKRVMEEECFSFLIKQKYHIIRWFRDRTSILRVYYQKEPQVSIYVISRWHFYICMQGILQYKRIL